jgi:tetratricopeptide (TPR) repeat protein
LARYLEIRISGEPCAGFYASLKSSPSQTCLDLAYDLLEAGMEQEAMDLLEGVNAPASPMVSYTLGMLYLNRGETATAQSHFAEAERATLGKTYPFRLAELKVLKGVVAHDPSLARAWFYMGCLLYDKTHYAESAACWQKAIEINAGYYAPYRNLAVAYFSHLDRKDEVLPLLEKAMVLASATPQLVFETSHVMAKLGIAPAQRAAFLEHQCKEGRMRDDIVLEWARALNQMGCSERALKLLLSHRFVSCEGGEHAVAEQYMFAQHQLGREHLRHGRYEEALARFQSAQVLPTSLGAGLWHQALLVPHRYYEGLCLMRLGNLDQAMEIFRRIVSQPQEYFSEMHLPELPVYQAMAMELMGQKTRAEQRLRSLLGQWTDALSQKDAGWFKTTPFFISYVDSPQLARVSHFRYLLGLTKAALKDRDGAKEEFSQSVKCDPSRLYPWLENQWVHYEP